MSCVCIRMKMRRMRMYPGCRKCPSLPLTFLPIRSSVRNCPWRHIALPSCFRKSCARNNVRSLRLIYVRALDDGGVRDPNKGCMGGAVLPRTMDCRTKGPRIRLLPPRTMGHSTSFPSTTGHSSAPSSCNTTGFPRRLHRPGCNMSMDMCCSRCL